MPANIPFENIIRECTGKLIYFPNIANPDSDWEAIKQLVIQLSRLQINATNRPASLAQINALWSTEISPGVTLGQYLIYQLKMRYQNQIDFGKIRLWPEYPNVEITEENLGHVVVFFNHIMGDVYRAVKSPLNPQALLEAKLQSLNAALEGKKNIAEIKETFLDYMIAYEILQKAVEQKIGSAESLHYDGNASLKAEGQLLSNWKAHKIVLKKIAGKLAISSNDLPQTYKELLPFMERIRRSMQIDREVTYNQAYENLLRREYLIKDNRFARLRIQSGPPRREIQPEYEAEEAVENDEAAIGAILSAVNVEPLEPERNDTSDDESELELEDLDDTSFEEVSFSDADDDNDEVRTIFEDTMPETEDYYWSSEQGRYLPHQYDVMKVAFQPHKSLLTKCAFAEQDLWIELFRLLAREKDFSQRERMIRAALTLVQKSLSAVSRETSDDILIALDADTTVTSPESTETNDMLDSKDVLRISQLMRDLIGISQEKAYIARKTCGDFERESDVSTGAYNLAFSYVGMEYGLFDDPMKRIYPFDDARIPTAEIAATDWINDFKEIALPSAEVLQPALGDKPSGKDKLAFSNQALSGAVAKKVVIANTMADEFLKEQEITSFKAPFLHHQLQDRAMHQKSVAQNLHIDVNDADIFEKINLTEAIAKQSNFNPKVVKSETDSKENAKTTVFLLKQEIIEKEMKSLQEKHPGKRPVLITQLLEEKERTLTQQVTGKSASTVAAVAVSNCARKDANQLCATENPNGICAKLTELVSDTSVLSEKDRNAISQELMDFSDRLRNKKPGKIEFVLEKNNDSRYDLSFVLKVKIGGGKPRLISKDLKKLMITQLPSGESINAYDWIFRKIQAVEADLLSQIKNENNKSEEKYAIKCIGNVTVDEIGASKSNVEVSTRANHLMGSQPVFVPKPKSGEDLLIDNRQHPRNTH